MEQSLATIVDRKPGWPFRELRLPLAGAVLIVLALVLAFGPWGPRPPDPGEYYRSINTNAASPPLTGWDDPRLLRRAGESDLDFAGRLSAELRAAIWFCEDPQGSQLWLWPVLARLGLVDGSKIGVLTAAGIRCGMCHAYAYVADRALRQAGIEAEAYGLSGHVVTRFTVDGVTYYLDPSFGVPPIRADQPGLEQVLFEAYSVHANLEIARQLVGMFLSPEDNAPYVGQPFLDGYAASQDRVLEVQRLIEFALLGLGVVLVVGPWLKAWRRAAP